LKLEKRGEKKKKEEERSERMGGLNERGASVQANTRYTENQTARKERESTGQRLTKQRHPERTNTGKERKRGKAIELSIRNAHGTHTRHCFLVCCFEIGTRKKKKGGRTRKKKEKI